MNKADVKKLLKKRNFKVTSEVLKEAEKLKIKWQLAYQEGSKMIFKLSYKNKHIYLNNSFLYKNIDKLSVYVVSNKDLVKKELDQKGIKTPRGFVVKKYKEIKPLIEKNKINFPLVLKPGFAACGKGVFPNLLNEKDLKKAFKIARGIKHKYKEKPIIIEEYFQGRDYRLLVLEGKFIACCERVRPEIEGDGKSKVSQLIKEITKNSNLKLDWEITRNLKKQKVKLNQVLPLGQVVRLRESANICGGGISVNYTDQVCSKFRAIAEYCAKEFDGQLIGVDILTSDISNPQADYRVIELNDSPSLYDLHKFPDKGKS